MTPELKKAIELEQSYQKEIQKKSYHGKRELSVEEGVDAFWNWGKFAGSFVDYCHAHPQIAKEAKAQLKEIDNRIANIKRKGDRELASNAELKRKRGAVERIRAQKQKKQRLLLAIGIPVALALTALLYWFLGSQFGLYLHELNNTWDFHIYFQQVGAILFAPLVAFLIVYLVAVSKLNNKLADAQHEYSLQKDWIRQEAESNTLAEIRRLEESKKSYENVIRSVHANGDVALYHRSSLD